MKAGTTIFLAMIIFIAFGFVISEYIQIRGQIKKLELQNSMLRDQINQVGKNLETCQNENQAYLQNVVEKEGEITILKDQLSEQEDMLNFCQARNTEQERLLATCAAIQAGQQETITSLNNEIAQKDARIALIENQSICNTEALQRAPLAPETTDLSETNPFLLGAIMVIQVAYFLVKKGKG